MLSSWTLFHMRNEKKIRGSQVWLYGGWSNTSHRKHCRSLFVAAAWPNIVMKDNAWWRYSFSLVLNKEIELQHAFHIWRETLLFYAGLCAHYAPRIDKCDVMQLTGILETLHNTSVQRFTWFSLWFWCRDQSDLENKNSPHIFYALALPYSPSHFLMASFCCHTSSNYILPFYIPFD